MVARLVERYKNEIAPALAQEFKLKNRLGVPRLEKIVVSMGLGKVMDEEGRLEAAAG